MSPNKIPKLQPPSQNYSRSKNGLLGREEWLSVNETRISELWDSLRSYLRHTNTTILDKCTYVDFSDFVARYSSHFTEYY
ncbi:unnamed protein product [Sphacelaria rigidula]